MGNKLKYVLLLIFVFFLGYWLHMPSGNPVSEKHAGLSRAVSQAAEMTCSMHPQIRQPKAGKCPLCGMDLISVSGNSRCECGPKELKLSEADEKISAIETMPVERKFVPVEIRMLGKIAYNDYTQAYINARFSGRVDKVFAKSTGITVKKGDHLAVVYSQELRVLLQELIQALSVKESKPDVPSSTTFLNSVKEKYRFSGFSEDQLEEIIDKLKGAERLTFVNSQVSGMLLSVTSPISGVIVDKVPVVGRYFEKGEILYIIADLSSVWVNVEAYETDLPWLKCGQDVEFTTEACPGERFKGRIALIQPVLDEATRTVKVRIAADNSTGKLKPGMFVDATVCAKIAEGGKVVDCSLAGKWICPMQPEVISDGPGLCGICGKPLSTAESLGLASKEDMDIPPPLVIPASAPLITGKRAVVYVAVPGRSGVYEGKEINLGARSGNYFIVKSGLKEGEKVVSNGSFKIDSTLQILAKSSMMNQLGENDPEPAVAVSDNAVMGNAPPPPDDIIQEYLQVRKALFTDNLDEVIRHAKKLDGRYHANLAFSKDIWEARKAFEEISKLFHRELAGSKMNLKKPFFKMFCPMAFEGRGAFWIQDSEKVENPYFGPTMPECGELKETIPGRK